jgi:hypothetical protein
MNSLYSLTSYLFVAFTDGVQFQIVLTIAPSSPNLLSTLQRSCKCCLLPNHFFRSRKFDPVHRIQQPPFVKFASSHISFKGPRSLFTSNYYTHLCIFSEFALPPPILFICYHLLTGTDRRSNRFSPPMEAIIASSHHGFRFDTKLCRILDQVRLEANIFLAHALYPQCPHHTSSTEALGLAHKVFGGRNVALQVRDFLFHWALLPHTE